MLEIFTAERVRKELRGIAFTLGLVALITLALFFFQRESGITHGSVIYLVPVVIAAVRWGIVPAIVAAWFGVFASAFFFYPPLYSFTIADPREAIDLNSSSSSHCRSASLPPASRRKRNWRGSGKSTCATSTHSPAGWPSRSTSPISMPPSRITSPLRQRKVVLFASRPRGFDQHGPPCRVLVPQSVRDTVASIASGSLNPAAGLT